MLDQIPVLGQAAEVVHPYIAIQIRFGRNVPGEESMVSLGGKTLYKKWE